jgi:hypothetical protein
VIAPDFNVPIITFSCIQVQATHPQKGSC